MLSISSVLKVFVFVLATCILLHGNLVVHVFVGSGTGLDLLNVFVLASCILSYGNLVVHVFVGSSTGLDLSQNEEIPLGLDTKSKTQLE